MLKDLFNNVREKLNGGQSVYIVGLKQTPSNPDEPDIKKLRAEQTGYVQSLRDLQKQNSGDFKHIVPPEKDHLTGVVVVVCTKEIAAKIREIDGISFIFKRPDLSIRSVMKQKTLKVEPC